MGLWSCFSFIIITEVYRQVGPCVKERSIGAAGDRMIEMILLFLCRHVWLVSFRMMNE